MKKPMDKTTTVRTLIDTLGFEPVTPLPETQASVQATGHASGQEAARASEQTTGQASEQEAGQGSGNAPNPLHDAFARRVESVYCCDLLSVAMGKAPAGCAWATVMGNINAVAVAALTDAACVIVADGADVEPRAVSKAAQQGVAVLRSALPVFETAHAVHMLITSG